MTSQYLLASTGVARPSRVPRGQHRSRSWLAQISLTAFVAATGVLIAPSAVSAQGCAGGVESDFNGDGVADIAVGDPRATVSGAESAGRVTVAFGGGGSQTVTQMDFLDNDNAAGDWFGHALASTDWNQDGCADLVIGVPYEDWDHNTVVDAGVVVVIPGSPIGLDPDGAIYWNQVSLGQNLEVDDRLGWSLAAGTAPSGDPFILMGSPGEDTGDIVDAGLITYRTPSITISVNQNSPGVPSSVERGDLYGHAVAATSSSFAIGAAGEAAGGEDENAVGSVHLFEHPSSSSVPALIAGWDQDIPGFSGESEANDLYGYALDMVDYRPPSSSSTATLVAVGSHGEGIGTADGAGRVVVVEDNGTVTELNEYHQGEDGIEDAVETGDHFGYSVALVNRTPGQAATWSSLLLAAGVPGEDAGAPELVDRGDVQVFSLIGAPGDHDVSAMPFLTAAGLTPTADARVGQSVHATAEYLFVAAPSSDPVAVYGIPWANIIDGASEPVWVIAPGSDGIPADGVGVFGQAMA